MLHHGSLNDLFQCFLIKNIHSCSSLSILMFISNHQLSSISRVRKGNPQRFDNLVPSALLLISMASYHCPVKIVRRKNFFGFSSKFLKVMKIVTRDVL